MKSLLIKSLFGLLFLTSTSLYGTDHLIDFSLPYLSLGYQKKIAPQATLQGAIGPYNQSIRWTYYQKPDLTGYRHSINGTHIDTEDIEELLEDVFSPFNSNQGIEDIWMLGVGFGYQWTLNTNTLFGFDLDFFVLNMDDEFYLGTLPRISITYAFVKTTVEDGPRRKE